MSESQLAQLTDTEIVLAFREALLGVLPIAIKLECLADDTQPYDDFDAIAEVLWDVLARRSFEWKYGLSALSLPQYGMYGSVKTLGARVIVRDRQLAATFVEFIGDRSFGPEPLNAVGVMDGAGSPQRWQLTSVVRFELETI
jgi:hypothetical protein